MIRVLIADDEPLIRAGIRTVLESAGDIVVVAEAADGAQVVAQALRHRVEVALVDIRMPVVDGLSAAEALRDKASAVRVVMVTSFSEEPNVLQAVRRGAAGFVLKTCTPDELITAVRAAHRGDAFLSPTVTRQLLELVTAGVDSGRREQATALVATLTAREQAVLGQVARGLSNADIGQALHMSETTIKTYVSRILVKLHCANRVQAALLARDAGPS